MWEQEGRFSSSLEGRREEVKTRNRRTSEGSRRWRERKGRREKAERQEGRGSGENKIHLTQSFP